jgi:hypothetical protein
MLSQPPLCEMAVDETSCACNYDVVHWHNLGAGASRGSGGFGMGPRFFLGLPIQAAIWDTTVSDCFFSQQTREIEPFGLVASAALGH